MVPIRVIRGPINTARPETHKLDNQVWHAKPCPFFASRLRFQPRLQFILTVLVFLQCPGLPPSIFLRCFAKKFKQRWFEGPPTPISIESIPLNHHRSLISSILNVSDTDCRVLLSRKSFAGSPNLKKSRRVFQHPIDGKLDRPFATIPSRLILFNSCQNDYTRIWICLKLHPVLYIFIPQSCPSAALILESPTISFSNHRSVVPSILKLSDTDFCVLMCRKSYERSQKSKKSK